MNLRKTISYLLLQVILLFLLRPCLANSTNTVQNPLTYPTILHSTPSTTNNNQLASDFVKLRRDKTIIRLCNATSRYATETSLPTKLQWYISNGKDVVGTTNDAAEGKQVDSYNYTPYGRAATLSSVAGSPWTVVGKDGQQTVDRLLIPSELQSNSSKIKPCRADLSRRSSELRTQAEVLNEGEPCRAEATSVGGNLTFNITTNPFRYSGYYLDALSGLYYLNARYYSPDFMRFISRDSYDLSNRYAYCNDDPASNVDPSGHSALNWLERNGKKYFSVEIGIAAAAIVACASEGSCSALLGMEIGNSISAGTNFGIDVEHHNSKGELADAVMTISGLCGAYSAQPTMFAFGKEAQTSLEALSEVPSFKNGMFIASIEEGGTDVQAEALAVLNRGKKFQLISSVGSQAIQGAAMGMGNSNGSLAQEFEFGAIGFAGGATGGLSYGTISNIFKATKGLGTFTQFGDSLWKGFMRSGLTNTMQEMAVVGTDFIAGGSKLHHLWRKVGIGEASGFISGAISGVTQVGQNNYKGIISKSFRMSYLFVKGPLLKKFMTNS